MWCCCRDAAGPAVGLTRLLAAEDAVAASVGSSAVLLRRCGGGCCEIERWCSVVLLWCCSCPALVLLQQLQPGWFHALRLRSLQKMPRPRWAAVRYCCGDVAADAANSKGGAVWCCCGTAAALLRCCFSSFGEVGFVQAASWVKGRDGGGVSWRVCTRARARIDNTVVF